jgi:hypothetical protein
VANIGYGRAIWISGARVWGEAILEILVVSVISLIPLIGAAIREVLPQDSKIYLSDAFEKAFLSGQLLFYALGLIATIIWQSSRDLKQFFAIRAVLFLFGISSVAFCSVIIGYDPTLTSENKALLGPFSAGLFAVSIVLYVVMSVFSQVQVNVGEELTKDDKALADAVRRSRGIPQ